MSNLSKDEYDLFINRVKILKYECNPFINHIDLCNTKIKINFKNNKYANIIFKNKL